MKKLFAAIAFSILSLTIGGSAAQATEARERVVQELAEYTEQRRDITISGETFSLLKLNYGDAVEQLAVDDKGHLLNKEEMRKLNLAQ